MILTVIFNLFATELTFSYHDLQYRFSCDEKELLFTGLSGRTRLRLNSCNQKAILPFCQKIDFNVDQLKMLSVNRDLIDQFISINVNNNTYFEKASTDIGKVFLNVPRSIEQLILYNELYCEPKE